MDRVLEAGSTSDTGLSVRPANISLLSALRAGVATFSSTILNDWGAICRFMTEAAELNAAAVLRSSRRKRAWVTTTVTCVLPQRRLDSIIPKLAKREELKDD